MIALDEHPRSPASPGPRPSVARQAPPPSRRRTAPSPATPRPWCRRPVDRGVALRRHRLRVHRCRRLHELAGAGHPRSLVLPVFDLQSGSAAVTTFRADGEFLGRVASGDDRRAGRLTGTGRAAPGDPAGDAARRCRPAVRDHATGAGDPAGLDAVMLEPLVSRLVLSGDDHGTALLRARRHGRKAPGARGRQRRGARRRPSTAAGRSGRSSVTSPADGRPSRAAPEGSPWSVADRTDRDSRSSTDERTRRHDRSRHRPMQSSRSGPSAPYEENPILRPQGDGWESASVYNPAAVVKDGQVVLLYRAHADDIVSHVGLATSDDGIHFERHPEPVLSPTEDYEKFGCEDPRVTEIDGTYYLTYSGWDRQVRPAVPGHVDRPVQLDQARPDVPRLQHVPPAGQRARRAVEQGRRDPAGADRRPLSHVLRRGLDLVRVVRRPDPLEALLERRADDDPDPAGDLRRVPGRGRPAADHHQQRPDPAGPQRRREVRRRHGALHQRSAAVLPGRSDQDPRADEPAVAGADDLRGQARPGVQRDVRRRAGVLPRLVVRLLRPERLDPGRRDLQGG